MAYEEFGSKYPNSKHRDELLGRLAWAEATRIDTAAAYAEFLSAHPDGPNAPEAKRRRDERGRVAVEDCMRKCGKVRFVKKIFHGGVRVGPTHLLGPFPFLTPIFPNNECTKRCARTYPGYKCTYEQTAGALEKCEKL